MQQLVNKLGIVTKRIRGIEYQYYQTPYKTKDKTIIVTTEIGRKDLDPKEFSKRRSSAMIRHGNKIRELYFTPERLTRYHFEHSPTDCNIFGVEQLKFAQLTLVDELTKDERREFERILFTKYVYGTTSLEGNTYSEGETDKLLNAGLTSGNKTHREATEITNYLEVRSFVNDYRGMISEQFIKNIHSILMKGIKDDSGKFILTGKYRTTDKGIRGISYKLCPLYLIEQKMNDLMSEYEIGMKKRIHPLELACIFHQKFEEIHPFEDGNGRTGREILNYMLRRNGLPEIYIPPKDRSLYLTTLEEGNLLNYIPLIDFVLHRILMTLLYYLTKSNASDEMASDEFAEFYKSTEGEENYANFRAIFDSLYKNKILP